MATEMPVAATTPEEVEDVVVVVEEPILPFDTLDDQELKPLRSGPRFSSTNANPQLHYGPVTIRSSPCRSGILKVAETVSPRKLHGW